MRQKIVNRIEIEIRKALNGPTLNKKIDVNETVAIFGSPRTGTTWLEELINVNLDYFTISRPMAIEWFPKSRKIGIETRPYYHPETENKILEQYLHDVFTCKLSALKGGNFQYKLNVDVYLARLRAEKLLVKFNSGVRLLPWIEKRFDLRKMFLVTRHPCATISSQIQAGGRVAYGPLANYGVPNTEMIVKEISNMDFIQDSLRDKIRNISSIAERLAAVWALDNLIPFRFSKSLDIVCYENLMVNSDIEVSRIFSELNQIEYLENAFDILRKPSRSTEKEEIEYLSNIESQLTKWKKRLSVEDISQISKVLGWFEMGFSENQYYILDNRFPFKI